MICPIKQSYSKQLRDRGSRAAQLSLQSRLLLSKLFRLLLNLETALSTVKQGLFNKSNLTLSSLFNTVKEGSKSYLSKKEIQNLMRRFNKILTTDELSLILDRFNASTLGITFSQFTAELSLI